MAKRQPRIPKLAGIAAVSAASVLAVAAAHPALAQQGRAGVQPRTVPAGEKRQLAFFTSVNPDCSVNGEMTVRIARPAQHGSVQIEPGVGYTDFGAGDLRYFCNLFPEEGYQISYVPNVDFKGEDRFDIEFFPAGGQYKLWRYAVTVK